MIIALKHAQSIPESAPKSESTPESAPESESTPELVPEWTPESESASELIPESAPESKSALESEMAHKLESATKRSQFRHRHKKGVWVQSY